jgi:two-component system, NarL family, nitrate/nitrite response regulator NarL
MRVLLVDDHQLVREALSHYLKSGDGSIDVVEAGSLEDVVRQGYRAPFDVVLLDYRLPGTKGDAAIAAMRQLFPETPVIVLSGAITREEARSALVGGAAGVISKDIEGRRLLQTIRDIIGGELQISGLAEPSSLPPIPLAAPQERGRAANLSNREAQVARLLVEGLSNKEIAKALGIADITVRLHLRRVFHKVGARNRIDAVRIILMSAADVGGAPPGSLAARRRGGA